VLGYFLGSAHGASAAHRHRRLAGALAGLLLH
jgi:hypothetical protein